MIRFTIHMPEGLHEMLCWLAYKERRSRQTIVLEILEKALVDVKNEEKEN